ncbi:PGA, partial [Symbiodinium sp. CCMP2456]
MPTSNSARHQRARGEGSCETAEETSNYWLRIFPLPPRFGYIAIKKLTRDLLQTDKDLVTGETNNEKRYALMCMSSQEIAEQLAAKVRGHCPQPGAEPLNAELYSEEERHAQFGPLQAQQRALQSSQPMQLGRHEKPSEQLVGGTKRFVIVRNLTPDAKSYAWFRRFPASDRMKTATVHGHKGGPRWAALECASEEDAMRLAKEVAAFEVPAEASGPFQAKYRDQRETLYDSLRVGREAPGRAGPSRPCLTEDLSDETTVRRSGVKTVAKSAGMTDKSDETTAGMTDGKIVERNAGTIVEMSAETTGETSAARIAEMTGERTGGTSGEMSVEMIGEIRGNIVMTANNAQFAWKIAVMTGVTIADTSEEKIEHMKEMRGETIAKVTAEVIAERSGMRIVMGMDDRSSAGTIVRSITDAILRKSSRAPGTMMMDPIMVGKTDAKSDAMIGEMTDGTTVAKSAEMIGDMRRGVTTGEAGSAPAKSAGQRVASSAKTIEAGWRGPVLGAWALAEQRFGGDFGGGLWSHGLPGRVQAQDRRDAKSQQDYPASRRSDGEALPGQLTIQSAPQPSIAPALRDIDRTRREQARSEAEKKAVAAEQASLEKQKEAIRANERLQNAKRKAEEVGLALQEQQKRAKALYEEAQAKMKEAELAEQASLEAGGAAERYKDYSAQADRDAQQASMEAARLAKDAAVAKQEAQKLRAAAGKIMIE